jgi:hypothetical protein
VSSPCPASLVLTCSCVHILLLPLLLVSFMVFCLRS